MEDGKCAAISGYLEYGTYPAVFTNFILRKSCKNYKLLKGKLYYKEQIQDGTERDRLIVKRSEANRVKQTEFSRIHRLKERHHTLATA